MLSCNLFFVRISVLYLGFVYLVAIVLSAVCSSQRNVTLISHITVAWQFKP